MKTILTVLIFSSIFGTSLLSPCAAGMKRPGMTPMFLHNEKSGELKTRCLEVMGRYDYRPHFECFDDTGSLKRFDPGKEWRPVPLTPACFRHKNRGTIKSCAAYQLKNDQAARYVCHDNQSGKYTTFTIDSEWDLLKNDDPACREREFGPDVIRKFEFEISTDLEKDTQKNDSCMEDNTGK